MLSDVDSWTTLTSEVQFFAQFARFESLMC